LPDIFDLVVKQRASLAEALSWPGIRGRMFKYEYAAIEIALLEKFERSLTGSKSPSVIETDGFVTRVGGTEFILRSSLAIDSGIICEMEDPRQLPTDFEFGRIKAYRILSSTKSRRNVRGKLKVVDFEPIRLPTEHLKPSISLGDAGDILFEQYPDSPDQIKRNLVLSLTSAPGGSMRLGGLTAALLPLQEDFAGLSVDILQDLKASIPTDLTSESRVSVSIPDVGKFEISPFPWSMRNTSSAHFDSKSDSLFPQSNVRAAFDEKTIGISANNVAPKSLDELWMKSADFPVLLERSLQRYGRPLGFDLDLAKFFITVHSARPFTDRDVENNLLQLVQPRLNKLRKNYDNLGYSGLVDLDVRSGSPRSIIAIAKSMARTHGTERIDADIVGLALSEFVNSREDMFEAWAERGLDYGNLTISTEKKLKMIGRTAERIYVFVREHPSVSRSEIRETFPRVQETIFANTLDEMIKRGIIYVSSNIDECYSAA
jgi:hypothetical protein